MSHPSFDSEELGLLASVLGEVLHGFAIPEFDRRIGMKRIDLQNLFSQLRMTGNDKSAFLLDVNQTHAVRNALSETIKELGREEFHTRTGYDFDYATGFLQRLNRLLGDQGT